jgi:hypothetical protein
MEETMSGPVPAHGDDTTYDAPRPDPVPRYREVQPDEYTRLREQQQGSPMPLRAPQPAPVEEQPTTDDRQQPYDDLRAEVATEREREDDAAAAEGRDVPDGAIAVPLEGRNGRGVIHVLDPQDWPSAANGDLRVGDFESWAAECLAPGDYEDVWQDVEPTLRHVNAMFTEWRKLSGNDRGKSPRSMASYRRTRRR